MTLHSILQRYVRSLTEREGASEAPEHSQDLGTFVYWLLRRHGFRVLRRVFVYEGPERRMLSGIREWGVDILATRQEAEALVEYRFVLKTGDVKRWVHEEGSILEDLANAAEATAAQGPGQQDTPSKVVVVAVHNGDLREALWPQVKSATAKWAERNGVSYDWWDADRLVELALAPAADGSTLDQVADASLFPPASQVFVRLALDSLVRDNGARFDLDAVNRLLDVVLPVGAEGAGAEGRPTAAANEARRFRRSSNELALFAALVEVESRARAGGNILPVAETLERVMCRLLEHARRPEASGLDEAAVLDLLSAYVATSLRLLERIAPLLITIGALALPWDSERVDYPLRTLRFLGILAVGGLAALDLGDKKSAGILAGGVVRTIEMNPAGALMPVIDDQLIELAAAWRLLLSTSREAQAGAIAAELIERLAARLRFRVPLPAIWMRTTFPLLPRDAEALALAYVLNDRSTIEDGASTILPFAVHVASTFGPGVSDEELLVFAPSAQIDEESVQPQRGVYAEIWDPPEDAADRWYAGDISDLGNTRVLELAKGVRVFGESVSRSIQVVPTSAASDKGWSSIDWMAFKLWRTLPPLGLLV